MKSAKIGCLSARARRTPHGVRGLKSLLLLALVDHLLMVAPLTGCVD